MKSIPRQARGKVPLYFCTFEQRPPDGRGLARVPIRGAESRSSSSKESYTGQSLRHNFHRYGPAPSRPHGPSSVALVWVAARIFLALCVAGLSDEMKQRNSSTKSIRRAFELCSYHFLSRHKFPVYRGAAHVRKLNMRIAAHVRKLALIFEGDSSERNYALRSH